MIADISCRGLTQCGLQDGGQNGGCARQGNSIRQVNTRKIDDISDSLRGDREIKRRLNGRHNMMTRLS